MAEIENQSLTWTDQISNDSDSFIIPPGTYAFKVKTFEKAHYPGSDKMCACPMAKLGIEIDGGDEGMSYVNHRLFLHKKTESFLCQFFRSIGARQSGQAYEMDWDRVQGQTGFCKTGIRKYYDKGVENIIENQKECMEIKSFLDAPIAEEPAF
jgi:hypothetical protein